MMLTTFLGALLVVTICFVAFIWLGSPFYRLEPVNVRALLTLLLQGEATESDWDVFAGVPIRHNPQLEEIRHRCCEIVAQEAVIRNGKVQLSNRGKQRVELLLQTLP